MTKHIFSLERIAFGIVAALVGLLPIFFLPYLPVALQSAKVLLLGVGVVIAGLFFIIVALRSQRLVVPRSIWTYSVLLLPFAYALATVFTSSNFSIFTNDAPVQDSFVFIALAAVFALLAALLAQTPERVLTLYGTLSAGGFIVLLYTVVRFFFGPGVFAFGGLFADPSLSLVGTLGQTAVFFGLLASLILIAFAVLELWGMLRTALYILFGLCIAYLLVVYVASVWVLVGIVALGTFVSGLIRGARKGAAGRSLSIMSLATLGLTVVMLFGGSAISSTLAPYLYVQNVEVRPSWQSTLSVGTNVVSTHPFFGVGPGHFADAWSLYRPREVNQTPFWDTRFPFGQSFIATSLVTTGFVGAVAWALFLIGFLVLGVRLLILSPGTDAFSFFFRLSAFVSALYLWAAAFLFGLPPSLLVLAFLFTGLTYGASMARPHGSITIAFEENPRLGFVAALALTVLFLAGIGGLFSFGKDFAASMLYTRSVVAGSGAGDLDQSELFLSRASVLSQSDTFFRYASLLSLARLNDLLSATGTSAETVRDRFPGYLSNAVGNARAAIALDDRDVRNWTTLAQVYQSVVPLNIEGSYEGAVAAYAEAEKRAPENPGIRLMRAGLERTKGNTKEALSLVDEALALKQNYTDAAFFRAQTFAAEGNVKEAIASVEAATIFAQDDPYLYFQLGLLRYSDGQSDAARTAFARAVELNASYANARYFLGLTYARLGDTDRALEQFEEVARTNPDNTDVAEIVSKLKKGISLFGSKSSAEDIQERERVPVEEDSDNGSISPDTP